MLTTHERFEKRLTRAAIKKEAGRKRFAQGEATFAAGQVRELEEIRAEIRATVQDDDQYYVRIWLEGTRPASSCTSEDSDEVDWDFCPHAVAAGLAWLGRGPAGSVDRWLDWHVELGLLLRPVLRRMDPAEAARLKQDPLEYWFRLQLERARDRRGRFRPAVFRRQIDLAIRKPDRLGGRVAMHCVERIRWLAPTLEYLLNHGYAAEVLDLAEYGVRKLGAAGDEFPDDHHELWMGVNTLRLIFAKALSRAERRPEVLARQLLDLQLAGIEGFWPEVEDFVPQMTLALRTAYRELVEAELDKVASRKRGDRRRDALWNLLVELKQDPPRTRPFAGV